MFYLYSKQTKLFLRPSDVDLTSDDIGSTKKAPPEVHDGSFVMWSKGGWTVVKNRSGEVLYDKKTGLPVKLSGIPPYNEDLAETAPEAVPSYWDGSKWVKDKKLDKEWKKKAELHELRRDKARFDLFEVVAALVLDKPIEKGIKDELKRVYEGLSKHNTAAE